MANFSPQGQTELDAKVAKYKLELETEAERIELARNRNGPQEVSPHDVRKADFLVREGMNETLRGKYDFIPILLTPAAAGLLGWATNNTDSGWGVLAIAVSIVLIFGSEIYKWNKGGK